MEKTKTDYFYYMLTHKTDLTGTVLADYYLLF